VRFGEPLRLYRVYLPGKASSEDESFVAVRSRIRAAGGLALLQASPARVYDYLAGGRDNFAADRKLAGRLLDLAPHVRVMVQENRTFLNTAVRWAAAQGVAQFIDLGSGLPTAPAIHETVKAASPDARVAYVDNDPVVVSHLVAVASKDPVVTIIGGDLRDAQDILTTPPFDHGAPACLVAGWVLHFFPHDIAAGLVRRYVTALARRGGLKGEPVLDRLWQDPAEGISPAARLLRSATAVSAARTSSLAPYSDRISRSSLARTPRSPVSIRLTLERSQSRTRAAWSRL